MQPGVITAGSSALVQVESSGADSIASSPLPRVLLRAAGEVVRAEPRLGSQIGVSTDGRETLEVLSTYVSLDGHLTEVRRPVSIVVERTFAFGGRGVVPRPSDRLDRLMLGMDLVRNLALRVGVSRRETAWPGVEQADELRATEMDYTIGGQYKLAW